MAGRLGCHRGVLITAVLWYAACGSPDEPIGPRAADIIVSPNAVRIAQLQAQLLDVQVIGQDGLSLDSVPIAFESSNEKIATVSNNGLIASVGPAGSVGITVRAGGIERRVDVTVTQVPTALRVVPDSIGLGPHRSVQLQASVMDAVHVPIIGPTIILESSPNSPFTISASGLLTAGQTLGSGTVTVRSGILEKSIPVNVISVGHPAGIIVATTNIATSSYGAAIARDGHVAVGGLEGHLARGSLPSFSLSSTQIGGYITAVAFSASGRLFASGTPANGVSEIDPSTGTVLRSLSNLSGMPHDLVVAPDEQTLFLSTWNGLVYFIDIPTFTVRHQVQLHGSLVHLALHPTQPLLYASQQEGVIPQASSEIFEVNTNTRTTRSILVAAPAAQAMAIANSGTKLYVASRAGTVEVVSLATGVSIASIATDCDNFGMAQTPNGRQLYVSCPLAGKIKIIDAINYSVHGTIDRGGTPTRVAVSPDGATIMVPNQAGWVDFIQ